MYFSMLLRFLFICVCVCACLQVGELERRVALESLQKDVDVEEISKADESRHQALQERCVGACVHPKKDATLPFFKQEIGKWIYLYTCIRL